jgi:hypothetical protein
MARFGGVTNPRSGARWDRKNDGRTTAELVEFKRTDNRHSITLLYSDLIGLYRHAVAESRRPVLAFELGGRNWVVLSESDYHELAERRYEPSPTSDLRADETSLVRRRQVPGPQRHWASQSVLRRPPAQWTGSGSQVRMSGDTPPAPRSVPGPSAMSRLRPGKRGEVGRLGGLQRKGTPPDQTPEAS